MLQGSAPGCSSTVSPAGARQKPLRVAEPQQQPHSIHPPGGALSQHPPLVLRGVRPCPALSCVRACLLSLFKAATLNASVPKKPQMIATFCVQHFHLSHNYADSISVVGRCAFVQVGVIGDCNRDGLRHSRLLRGVQGLPNPQGTCSGSRRHCPLSSSARNGPHDCSPLSCMQHLPDTAAETRVCCCRGPRRLPAVHGGPRGRQPAPGPGARVGGHNLAAAGAAGRPAAVRPAVGELTMSGPIIAMNEHAVSPSLPRHRILRGSRTTCCLKCAARRSLGTAGNRGWQQ